MALDHMEFLKRDKLYGTENELEFEIKSPDADLAAVTQWFKQNILAGSPAKLTGSSKAKRARRHLMAAGFDF